MAALIQMLPKTGESVTALDLLNLLCLAIITGGVGTTALAMLL
jgi:hypothetical protein